MDSKLQALEILKKQPYGVMGTVDGDKPYARIMTFIHDEDLTLYTIAPVHSNILKHVEHNTFTHILYGYEDHEDDVFLEIEGQVEQAEDTEKAMAVLQNYDRIHRNSFNEQHHVLLKIKPIRMRIMHTTRNEPLEVIIH